MSRFYGLARLYWIAIIYITSYLRHPVDLSQKLHMQRVFEFPDRVTSG